MELSSILGIIVSIAVFILLSYKNVSVVVIAPLAAVIVSILSGLDILETMKSVFMPRAAGIISSYFLLFALSALFGKLIADSGAARTIAHSLANIARRSKKTSTRKFLGILSIVVLNSILTYSGISLFVLVFTIVAIAKDLFEELDIPWGFYGFGVIGSATFTLSMLPGSPQVQNLIPRDYLGTTAMAAPVLGILSSIFMITICLFYLRYSIRKAEQRKEGFLPTGARISESQLSSEDFKPIPLWRCIIPLAVPFVVMNILNQAAETSLLCAVIVTYLLNFKEYKDIKQTINLGFTSAVNPLIVLGLATAFGSVMASTSGFTTIITQLYNLPLPEVVKMLITVIVPTAIVGSSSSGLTIALDLFADRYLAIGLAPEVIHKLTTMACNMSFTPHCSGLLNTFTITKMNHKEAYGYYFVITMVLGLITLIFATILAQFGIV